MSRGVYFWPGLGDVIGLHDLNYWIVEALGNPISAPGDDGSRRMDAGSRAIGHAVALGLIVPYARAHGSIEQAVPYPEHHRWPPAEPLEVVFLLEHALALVDGVSESATALTEKLATLETDLERFKTSRARSVEDVADEHAIAMRAHRIALRLQPFDLLGGDQPLGTWTPMAALEDFIRRHEGPDRTVKPDEMRAALVALYPTAFEPGRGSSFLRVRDGSEWSTWAKRTLGGNASRLRAKIWERGARRANKKRRSTNTKRRSTNT